MGKANKLQPFRKFGDQLRILRNERGLTYRDLDRLTGKSAQFWQAVVVNNAPASIESIKKAAKALEVEPGFFDEYRLRVAAAKLEEFKEELVDLLYYRIDNIHDARRLSELEDDYTKLLNEYDDLKDKYDDLRKRSGEPK